MEVNQYIKDGETELEMGDVVYLSPVADRINIFDEKGEESLLHEN